METMHGHGSWVSKRISEISLDRVRRREVELLKQFGAQCDVCGGADTLNGIQVTPFEVIAIFEFFGSHCMKEIDTNSNY
jgi:hypothetical protein